MYIIEDFELESRRIEAFLYMIERIDIENDENSIVVDNSINDLPF